MWQPCTILRYDLSLSKRCHQIQTTVPLSHSAPLNDGLLNTGSSISNDFKAAFLGTSTFNLQRKSTSWTTEFYRFPSKRPLHLEATCNIIQVSDSIRHVCSYFNCKIYHHHHHHHHHHVPEGLGLFPVPWSRCSWSLHLFLGRTMFLRPFVLYCSACFGSLFVSIFCACCSHFFLLYIHIYILICWCL